MRFLLLALLVGAFAVFASASTAATDLFVRDSLIYIGGEQTPDSGPAGTSITTLRTSTNQWGSFSWGCNGAVRSIQVIDEYVYIAGNFTKCDEAFYGPMARYNIQRGTYERVLPDGAVWDFSYDTTLEEWGNPMSIKTTQFYRGNIYIGGLFAINFTLPAEAAWRANNVAMYNPRTGTWRGFGAGVDGTVDSLFVQDEKTLFIGGTFQRAGWPNRGLDPIAEPHFWVWHEDHPVYGTGFGTYPIAIADNEFAPGWQLDGTVRQIWRGMVQMEPNGERLNPPLGTPEPARLTLVLVGDFTGGIIFQQDSLPWQRPHGGVWGGSVRALVPVTEQHYFLLAGGFTHAGAENSTDAGAVALGGFARWNYQNQVPRGGDWQDSRTWESNSNSQPHWDALEGGVSQGEVFAMSYEAASSQVFLVGSFQRPHRHITSYDMAQFAYEPVGAGNEFSADLHAVAVGVFQKPWSPWAGVWSDRTFFGFELRTCVTENRLVGTFDLGVIEGHVSANGQGVSGRFFLAGAVEGNSGRFGWVLSASGHGFSGWYSIDGEEGRWAWDEERLFDSDAPWLAECNSVDLGAEGTVEGQWMSAADGHLLRVCATYNEAVGSSSLGRYYRGMARGGLKTWQASFWGPDGYGLALLRQTSANVMMENWFLGDYRDISADRCTAGETCVVGHRFDREFTTRSSTLTCQSNAAKASFAGAWALDRLNAQLYIAVDGNGHMQGAGGPFMLEGTVDFAKGSASGTWFEAGWSERVGTLQGTFEVALANEGRTFEGAFNIPYDIDGNPLRQPFSFRWASQRLSYDQPNSQNAFVAAADAASAGANLNGRWVSERGDFVDVCRYTADEGTQYPMVVASASADGRFYAGDFVDGITASLSWWERNGEVYGAAVFKRVTKTTLQMMWYTGGPLDFDLNQCNSDTCLLTDRGVNSPLYKYAGPVSEADCLANYDGKRLPLNARNQIHK